MLEARSTGKVWVARYKACFNQDVVLLGPQFYDGMMLVADVMKRVNSTEPAKFLPMITNSHYKGVTADFSFDRSGNLQNAPVALSRVDGDHCEVVSVVH